MPAPEASRPAARGETATDQPVPSEVDQRSVDAAMVGATTADGATVDAAMVVGTHTDAMVDETTSTAAIERGRPSYSWRFGQDRRLEMVRRFVDLRDARILDVGCGIGTYVRGFRRYSDDVHGVEVEPDRVAEAGRELPNIVLARGEELPYPDAQFDLVFSNEVIEHVDDDRRTAAEMVRVTKPGGTIVVFAPNRLYPFETHGAYIGGRYVFGNIPFINWLPGPIRARFAPHVRAYTRGDIRTLFAGLPVRLAHHRVIYPGFDNVTARRPRVGRLLRRALRVAETTPLHHFGLSHFLVLRRIDATLQPSRTSRTRGPHSGTGSTWAGP